MQERRGQRSGVKISLYDDIHHEKYQVSCSCSNRNRLQAGIACGTLTGGAFNCVSSSIIGDNHTTHHWVLAFLVSGGIEGELIRDIF